jgi:hypothetical protein
VVRGGQLEEQLYAVDAVILHASTEAGFHHFFDTRLSARAARSRNRGNDHCQPALKTARRLTRSTKRVGHIARLATKIEDGDAFRCDHIPRFPTGLSHLQMVLEN